MEHYETILSQEANADIRSIIRYIAVNLREPTTAESLLHRFEETFLSLETMPERFLLVSDAYLASAGIRTVSVGNYLLFYTVNRNTKIVYILRVLYGKRNWIAILTEKPD